MSKSHKHRDNERSPGSAVAADPASKARVEALLVAGKTRDAVDAAKQRFKEMRDAESEGLLVDAYEAHVRTLMGRGMHREARALGAMTAERFPRHRDRFTALMRQSGLFSTGDVEPLLAELASAEGEGEGERRRELEAILRRELSDPALVADARALREDDPLKQAARAVRDVFTAVTTGSLPEGVLARLDPIPRQSPLAPWKLLIRAIDAYYRRADAAALANLAAIPADSAPARLAPALRALLGDPEAMQAPSLAVTALLDKVSGGRAHFQRYVTRLIEALSARDARQGATAVQDLLTVLRSAPTAVRRTAIATILRHWMRHDLDPDPLLEILNRKPEIDTSRLVALALEGTGAWDVALHAWDRYFSAARRTRVLPGSGPEVSRVLLHMAGLFPPDPEDVYDAFDVDSEEELQACVRSGELAAYADRGRLLEQARDADAVPAVFRALVAHHDKREPKRAEAEAEAWRLAYPKDLEPLLYLIRVAEQRGAVRKALGLLADAEAIDRVHQDVRRSRFRLLLASAERRLKDGKLALAAADLDHLEAEPSAHDGDTMSYLAALRWVAARKSAEALPDGQVATRPALSALILESVAISFGLEPPPPAEEPISQRHAVEALARAFDLFAVLDRPLRVDATRLARVEQDLAGATLTALHSLCAGGLAFGWPSLTYAASGQGLAHDGAQLHRFLLARGRALALAWTERERQRARACLRAARELASRARDMEAVREATTALRTVSAGMDVDPFARDNRSPDGEPLTQAEITKIVADERRRREVPRFATEAPPRKQRRRRKRQPRRGVFDDFLSFLEKTR
jgi:hypothetical protein